MAKCNHDCFNCKHDDCVNDKITQTEKMEANQRDLNFIDYGKVIYQKATCKKQRGRRFWHVTKEIKIDSINQLTNVINTYSAVASSWYATNGS